MRRIRHCDKQRSAQMCVMLRTCIGKMQWPDCKGMEYNVLLNIRLQLLKPCHVFATCHLLRILLDDYNRPLLFDGTGLLACRSSGFSPKRFGAPLLNSRMSQSFLALQGTASPFFSRLLTALIELGHDARRINFCGGDVLFEGAEPSTNFSGKMGDLPSYYEDMLRSGRYSDVVMFGDCRGVHEPIHGIAQDLGVNVHVFEEGYVRPHWITLERYGVNGRSRMPQDPAWFRKHRPAVPPEKATATGYSLRERAIHDIRYRFANSVFARRFPHYRTHRPHNGFKEYAGLGMRAIQQRRYDREADAVTNELMQRAAPYYLLPLQLNSDTQITVHSPFSGIEAVIEMVMRSFAVHAPSNAWLVIKNHPLDTGLIDYRRFAQRLAAELGLRERLRFIDAGHLPTLLEGARGVIVVNSTVGLSALHHRRPLMVLGTAIYDMPGLSFQGGLDDFWSYTESPDPELYQTFLDYVIQNTQINGDFYSRTGIEMAVRGAVRRLEAERH